MEDNKTALNIIKTAKTLGVHVHVGRVNTAKRYKLFADVGADTCDGSGIAMYEHMLTDIEASLERRELPTLFDGQEAEQQLAAIVAGVE